MESPIKNVELSFSCPEKWENLVDVGENKYCQKCKHLVVDFTKLTQKEFNDAVKNSPGRLCGRFKASQMSTRFLKYAAVTTTIAASVLVPTSCNEDDPLPANKEEVPVTIEMEEFMGDIPLTGIVFDPDVVQLDSVIIDEPGQELTGQ